MLKMYRENWENFDQVLTSLLPCGSTEWTQQMCFQVFRWLNRMPLLSFFCCGEYEIFGCGHIRASFRVWLRTVENVHVPKCMLIYHDVLQLTMCPDFLSLVSYLLTNMTVSFADELRQQLCGAGVIQSIVTCMRTLSHSTSVQEAACWALANLITSMFFKLGWGPREGA